MPPIVHWSIAWLIAYFIGSIPFGFLLAKSRGVDIRKHGSGNIGATNVGRVLGKRLGLLCFALDVMKGLGPSVAAGIVMGVIARPDLPPTTVLMWLAVPVFAIGGHMFPVWLGFRGGKGVATGLGALAGIFPVLTAAAVTALIVWLVSVKVTRYVGVSSCLAAAVMPIAALASRIATAYQRRASGEPFSMQDAVFSAWPYLLVTGLLALVVIYKHRGNLQRTLAGTEMKIGQRVTVPANQAT